MTRLKDPVVNPQSPRASPARQVSLQDRADLLALDAKINALLPPRYQNCYDAVSPASMGSASLVYGPDGKVAWDQIWTSFCELALAGGPPHRGTLLEPFTAEEVFAASQPYQDVVAEIARGIWMVTGLPVLPHVAPGWVGIRCLGENMASWLVRALVVENISARRERDFLHVPAGPHFRLDKEIKNVVTAVAKTHHYWTCHLPASPWTDVAAPVCSEHLEAALPAEALAAPAIYKTVVEEMERGIRNATSLRCVPSLHLWLGWRGLCRDVDMAVWLMRAVIALGLTVRRENHLLFLPASPKFLAEDKTRTVVERFAQACGLWETHLALR